MRRGARTRKEVGRKARSTHPDACSAAVSCAILLVMAAAILARVREGPLMNAPRRLVTALAWFTTIYAALAVVLNLATQSSSERAVFAPTAIILFVLVVTTMVGSRRTR